MRLRLSFAILCSGLVAACYGPPDRADILVSTDPPGAACLLSRQGQLLATIDPTPAIALVDPGLRDLAVTCRRSGFADASAVLPPRPASVYEQRIDIALVPNPIAVYPARLAR